MRQVAQIMGMPITLDIPDCDKPAVFNAVFDKLQKIDRKLSTYKPGSEVSRFRRGELDEKDLSPDLKQVIQACKKAQKATNGYFSAWAGEKFDPLGYVKGWAIDQAGKEVERQGYKTYCVSAGGDILAASNTDKVWNIGIQDPSDKTKILNKLSISNGAVCTSGNYERGKHIINPKSGQPADYWACVTVVGPDIITADILATACFAMGGRAVDFMASQDAFELLAVKAKT